MYKYTEEMLQKKVSRTPSNDVLYRDITGSGVRATLKRFYYDLFLLSYVHNQTSNYEYISTTQTIIRERKRQYLRYPGVIHPFSKFRCFWEYHMLLICFLKQILIGHNTSMFICKENYFEWGLGLFCECCIVVDLFVSAMTGFVDKDTRYIVLEQQLILEKFFSSRVFWHALGAIPLHGIIYFRFGITGRNCTCCNTGIFVAVTRIFSILGFVRAYDATAILNRKYNSYSLTSFRRYLRIALLDFIVNEYYSILHGSSYIIDVTINNEVPESLTTKLITHWYKLPTSQRPGLIVGTINNFCDCFSLAPVDVPHISEINSTYLIVKYILRYITNQIFCVWAILLTFEIISRELFMDEEIEVQQTRIRNMMRNQNVPDVIWKKVESYYRYPEAASMIIEKVNRLFGALPISIKNEIAVHCNSRYIKRVPCFVELPTNIMNEIALLLKEDIYMAGDTISNKYNRDEGMLLLDKGVLARYSEDGEELEHLIDGDYFDVVSLFYDIELDDSTVVAVSDTKILFLKKRRFRKVMKNYPDLFSRIKQQLQASNYQPFSKKI